MLIDATNIKFAILLIGSVFAVICTGLVVYSNTTSTSVRTEAVAAMAKGETARITELEKTIAGLKTKLESLESKQLIVASPQHTQTKAPQSKVQILWYTTFFGGLYTVQPEYIQACSSWCEYINDPTKLNDESVAGVIFHAKDFGGWPKKTVQNQHWVFMEQESASNSGWPEDFSQHVDVVLGSFQEAEIPSLYADPYTATKSPVHSIQEKNEFRKNGHAPLAILVSNCGANNNRKEYVEELLKHIPVDSFGGCVHTKDMPQDNDKMKLISQYKFYLAFENSNCKDYVTEKFFQALNVGTVPVVFGAPNIHEFAPTNHSIINVLDFASPKALAEYIKHLDENDNEYMKYLSYKDTSPGKGDGIAVVDSAWKNRFQPMANGWEYLGYCKLCQYVATRKPRKTNFVRPPCRNLHVNLKP